MTRDAYLRGYAGLSKVDVQESAIINCNNNGNDDDSDDEKIIIITTTQSARIEKWSRAGRSIDILI